MAKLSADTEGKTHVVCELFCIIGSVQRFIFFLFVDIQRSPCCFIGAVLFVYLLH